MNLYDINDREILEAATNERTFLKGRMYYYNERVAGLEYNSEAMKYSAVVEENKSYNVGIVARDDGEIDSYYCSCSAFGIHFGLCKHLVAFLYSLKTFFESEQSILLNNKRAVNEVLEYAAGFYRNNYETREIQLETTLFLEPVNGRITAGIELRAGEDRLYVIKDILDFIRSYHEGREMEFGKLFSLKPWLHIFGGEDKKTVELIMSIMEYEEQLSDLNPGDSKASLFKGRRLYLPDPHIRDFLRIHEGMGVKAVINGREFEKLPIVESEIPLKFCVTLQGDDIMLLHDAEEPVVPVSSAGRYYYYNGCMYRIPEKQERNFFPIMRGFYINSMPYILFPRTHRDTFMSEVLPMAQKSGDVVISDKLQKAVCREDLLIRVYVDKYKNGIKAEVRFVYGETSVNPFMNEKPELENDKILIRDSETEHKVLSLFEQSGFYVRSGFLYLLDDDQVYHFVYAMLPLIQENAEVYYSESFKKMALGSKGMFSGSIILDEDFEWLEFSFELKGIGRNEIISIISALREKKRYYRLKDGSFLPLESEELKDLGKIIEQLDVSDNELKELTLRLPKHRAVYVDSLLRESNVDNVERNNEFKQLVQNVKEPRDMDFAAPGELSGVLREYQKTGFKWLKTLAYYRMGGILADDMGLGKTLQVLAFIKSEKSNGNNSPALVVAPTSLLYNWKEEAEKFVPDIRVLAISGTKEERQMLMEKIKGVDLVVTSYPLIRNDIDTYEKYEFSYCFIDEAQHIKNPHTQSAKSVKRIKAGGYFALTGTPLENSLTELWSIFDFIMPGYLFSYNKFVTKFDVPITRNKNSEASRELARHISPFIIRRLKKDVLSELPDKIETYMRAELTNEQKKVYLAYLSKARGEVRGIQGTKTAGQERIRILAALTRLRQICCHPSLFIENYDGESGKMQLFDELIEDAIDSGHRILVFSQFTGMLELAGKLLTKKGLQYYVLKGDTPGSERLRMVKHFNEGDRDLFLISLKAGGTGLNLTGADMVIHFDPWWNPAVEDQATDRAYRIGQTRAVQVIKMITRGTVEEKIYHLQRRKKELVDAVIKPGETMLSRFSTEEIQDLFRE